VYKHCDFATDQTVWACCAIRLGLLGRGVRCRHGVWPGGTPAQALPRAWDGAVLLGPLGPCCAGARRARPGKDRLFLGQSVRWEKFFLSTGNFCSKKLASISLPRCGFDPAASACQDGSHRRAYRPCLLLFKRKQALKGPAMRHSREPAQASADPGAAPCGRRRGLSADRAPPLDAAAHCLPCGCP